MIQKNVSRKQAVLTDKKSSMVVSTGDFPLAATAILLRI